MIRIIFQFSLDTIEVRIENHSIYFRISQNPQFATIDGLKLDKSGVIKEFPDLKDSEQWQSIARQRFKERIKTMKSEAEIMKYIIKDLSKYGYVPLYFQRQGHRPVKIK